jgi:serine/threonine-protein kinase
MERVGVADPARIGRYRLLERLGVGGMAEIYKAVVDGPRGFARAVVVKRLLPQLSERKSLASAIASEARLSALLRHPNIVEVHDFGEADGECFLVMEFVDGPNLRMVMHAAATARRPLPPGLVACIISNVAAALAYAHALNDDQGQPLDIIHRDVSPSNIMLSWLGEVKLVDFGIARAASHIRDERTRTGTLKGKFGYMSPEQAAGEHIDRRSDIFSLGIVFYEALTLTRLFKGTNDLDTLRLVREARVIPPSRFLPGIDPAIDAVVMRMLAPSRAHRPATGDDVVAALLPTVHRHGADARGLAGLLRTLHPESARPAAPPAPVADDDPTLVTRRDPDR